jgi:hypothetical protein
LVLKVEQSRRARPKAKRATTLLVFAEARRRAVRLRGVAVLTKPAEVADPARRIANPKE